VSEPDVDALAREVESTLIGGRPRYTRAEVVARSGMAPDSARALWQALGFAAVGDDVPAFTDADAAALTAVRELTAELALDEHEVRAMARTLGRTFARLAAWQGGLLVDVLARRPDLVGSGDEVPAFLDRTLDAMQAIQSYVWRRQLAGYVSRVSSGAAAAETGTRMAVGFADMAQYTALTRRITETELRSVLDAFDSMTTEVIGARRGQVVKTIGDEVLFTADDPQDAAGIALALVEAAEQSDTLPPLRVGIAAGPVVSRLGDVFGQTVNIASRLTSHARAGTVLVDENMAAVLDGIEDYALRPLRPAALRGYHHLLSWRLRRARRDGGARFA
jgi:adenylate cyclase